MIEKKSIEIDGTKIFYVDARPDDPDRIAPNLLLVHGFLVSSACWEDILPGLASRFRVLAPDLPGSGESDIWKNRMVSFTRFASFLHAFLTRLEVKRTSVIGHSMGGGIAVITSAMYGQLLSKMVLMDSISYPFKQTLKARAVQARGIGPFIFKKLYGWGMFRSYFKNDVYYVKSRMNEQRLKAYYDAFNTTERREFSYDLMKMVTNPVEVEAKVPEIKTPTLIVWGGKDTLVPLSCGHRLAREIEGAKLEIIPECGHAPQEEAPDQALEVIFNFLQ